MKHIPILSTILFTALLAVAGTSYAQQPPDVVVSDGNGNTAMGTGALLGTNSLTFDNTAAGVDALFSGSGSMAGGGNTAIGSHALYSCSVCGSNSAVGDYALYSNETGSGNTAVGGLALTNNTGGNNAASGFWEAPSAVLKVPVVLHGIQSALLNLQAQHQLVAQR
jgi:hypothetical protein